MEQFFWRGIDLKGKEVKGYHQASSAADVETALRAQGIAVFAVKKKAPQWLALPSLSQLFSRTTISDQQRIYFFRSLSLLLSSGVDLSQALQVLALRVERFGGKMGTLITDLAAATKRGLSFSAALREQNNVCDEFIISLIEAGERAGAFAHILENSAQYYEDKSLLRSELRAAATLPLITLFFALGIVILVSVFIIPRFEELFLQTGKELPFLSRGMIALSAFLRSWACVGIALCCMIAFLAMRMISPAPLSVTKLLLPSAANIPLLASLFKNYDMITFLNTLTLLLQSGMPLVSALACARNVVTTPAVKNAASHVARLIAQGFSLEAAFKEFPAIFSADLIVMIGIAEKVGSLALMIKKSAEFYNADFKKQIALYTQILQPVLLIIVGGFIALLLAALYAPIMDLAHSIHT